MKTEQEIDKLYSEYRAENIESLKLYRKKHPNRRIKWSVLTREQFIEQLNEKGN